MPVCSVCGAQNAKRCGRCGQSYYCSRSCQIKDWETHKVVCGKEIPMLEKENKLITSKNIDGVGIRVHLVERTNESLTLKLLVFISPKSGDCRINSDACLLTVNDKLNDTTTRVRAKRGQSSILTEGEESKRCTNATLKGGDYVLMQVTFESPLIGEGKSAEGIIGIDVPLKMPILYVLQFRETGR